MKGGKADVAVRGFGQAALNVWILVPRIEKPNRSRLRKSRQPRDYALSVNLRR